MAPQYYFRAQNIIQIQYMNVERDKIEHAFYIRYSLLLNRKPQKALLRF